MPAAISAFWMASDTSSRFRRNLSSADIFCRRSWKLWKRGGGENRRTWVLSTKLITRKGYGKPYG